MRIFLPVCLPVLLSVASLACSDIRSSDTISIKRLVYLNQSTSALSDVKIRVHNTGEFVHCGYIVPGGECSTGFPLRQYQANRFDVSWVDNGRARAKKNILASKANNLLAGKPVRAVIVFGEQGQFSAKLQH